MKHLSLCLLLLASPLLASDANITWNQPPGGTPAESWSVYIGTAPGVYGAPVTGILVQNYSFPDGAMTLDVRNYVAVSAVNASGESLPSVEVHGFPRAIITSAVPEQQAGFIRLVVNGFNFSDGITSADIDFPGMTVTSVTRVNANLIMIDYTVDPGTPPVAADLTITNKWQDDAGLVVSVISEVFPVPTLVPLQPVIVDVN